MIFSLSFYSFVELFSDGSYIMSVYENFDVSVSRKFGYYYCVSWYKIAHRSIINAQFSDFLEYKN